MKLSLRYALIGLVALVALGGLISAFSAKPSSKATPLANPSAVWLEGECGDQGGVSLVIDFGSSSKQPTLVRCAPAFSGTGWDVFAAAGVEVAGTNTYPSGFACRISGWPTVEAQSCADTPSYKQGHWAYFYALPKAAKTWTLSGAGAALRKPECGGYEGWSFVQAGQNSGAYPPRFSPNAQYCKN